MADDNKGMNNNSLSRIATSSSQSFLCEDYKVYKWRWFILFVICILNFSNAMIWITFSPIADSTIVFFKIDSLQLNMLSLVYLIASIPFGFVASWLLDTLGLRTSIIMSAWLNAVGSILRNISTIDAMPQSAMYPVLLTGQILAACAQPFAMFAPTKVAALWFPGTQRATANMLASMANPLGILAANVIAPAVVSTPGDLPLALWVMTGPAVATVLLATFGICSSLPPTPPTSSAAEESEPFFKGLKQIVKNKNYWILNFCFGTGLAIFTALSSFFDQILCPRGYSDTFAGICGAIMIAAGAFGAVFAGLYVDRSKKFEEVVKVCFACAVLFGIMFTEVSRFRDQHVLIALSAALFGGFGFAIYPISMELAVEVTYPVAEATSAGLAIISGQSVSGSHLHVSDAVHSTTTSGQ
ncbi:hypothetical protein ACJMK2_005114 [Sinanodonta woodiana]|uniref:Uncharacterized protein n=1 Tax=Sinanodonta woodiana TaxID=1069815 RepID=A0ABD3VPP6_SINWO